MRTRTITLGEREYELKELALRPARKWREALEAEIGWVFDLLQGAQSLDSQDFGGIIEMLRGSTMRLSNSMDTVAELLFLFSPTLAADREYILDNAFASQAADAFIVAVELILPFFGMEQMPNLMRMMQQVGSLIRQTSTSLPEPSGDSGQTS